MTLNDVMAIILWSSTDSAALEANYVNVVDVCIVRGTYSF